MIMQRPKVVLFYNYLIKSKGLFKILNKMEGLKLDIELVTTITTFLTLIIAIKLFTDSVLEKELLIIKQIAFGI
jgi:hypothetical protein